MNTQVHRAIGDQIPLGQNPRVSISNLPLDPSLIQNLHTEVELCALLGVEDGIPIEEAIVKSYLATRSRTDDIIAAVAGAEDEAPDFNLNLLVPPPTSPPTVTTQAVPENGLPEYPIPIPAAAVQTPLPSDSSLGSPVTRSIFDVQFTPLMGSLSDKITEESAENHIERYGMKPQALSMSPTLEVAEAEESTENQVKRCVMKPVGLSVLTLPCPEKL